MKYPFIALITLAALLAISSPARADFSGPIVSIGDGDTLTVKGPAQNVTVRLACIDAPERAQAPWGTEATNKLKSFLPIGTNVKVREIETDRYGRKVGEIFIAGDSINLRMVSTGNAVVYKQYLNACGQTKQQYLNAEKNAKQRRLGIWQQSCIIMPWDYRAGKNSCSVAPSKSKLGYIPGTCKALKQQGIYGPFYANQNDPNYTTARDRDRDGIACE